MMLPRRLLLLLMSFLIAFSNGFAQNTLVETPHRTRRNVLEARRHETFHNTESRSGEDSFPSSGASVPNSWLYKFPPWFLPNNPAPEGFYDKSLLHGSGLILPKTHHQESSLPHSPSLHIGPSLPKALSTPSIQETSLPPSSDAQDGDILIVSDLVGGHRTGRMQNIKVRGNATFRDELVRTILEVKLLNKEVSPLVSSQFTTPLAPVFSSGATPFEVPHSAPQPSPPAPRPTQPFVLQDLGGDFHTNQGFVTTESTHSNLGGRGHQQLALFPSQTSRPSVAPQNIEHSNEFRPSPPDLTFAHLPPLPPSLQPPHQVAFSQSQHVGPETMRNPRPLNPPRHLSNRPIITKPSFNQGSGNRIHLPGPQIEHNDITDIFFRDQQEALLKASDKQTLRGNRVLDESGESIWIPFIPGIPLPILVQHTLATRRRQRAHGSTSPLHQRGQNCIGGCEFNVSPVHSSFSSHPSLNAPHTAPSQPLPLSRYPSQSSQPTSIQDIIGSDYDTSEELYRKAKGNSFSLRPSAGSSFADRTSGWNIRAFARS